MELGPGALVLASNAEALPGVPGSPGLNIPPGKGKAVKVGQTQREVRGGNREPGTFFNFPKPGSSEAKSNESVTVY